MGSDGTQGVRDIKSAGGTVIVQNPDSTEYNGMPCSALATGLVDYQLNPADIPAQLIDCARTQIVPANDTSPPFSHNKDALDKIFILLRAQTSHDFSQYKPSTIHRRIERRMVAQQIDTIEEYVKVIQH
jgi:two-component system CheB/CheR fusion protein